MRQRKKESAHLYSAGTSFVVTFNLRSNFHGDAIPIVYGNTLELGLGDPSKGVQLITANEGSIYNYTADVVFQSPVDANEVWYAYCFRPAFGAILPESVPRRFMPRLEATAELFDTIDQVTAVGDLLIHFHVRCFTEFGQNLYLSGNLPQLGEWDPDSAIQLFYEGNADYWTCNVRFPLSAKSRKIEYKYFRSFGGKKTEWEPEDNHKLQLGPVTSPAVIELADTFRWRDSPQNALTKAPFIEVINKRDQTDIEKPPKIFPNEARPGFVTTRFNVICPNVRKHQKLLICGSCPELGKWNIDDALELNGFYFPHWSLDLIMPRSSLPFEYKFVIVGDEIDDVDVEIETEEDQENNKTIENSSNNNNNVNNNTKSELTELNIVSNEIAQKKKIVKIVKERKIVHKVMWESEGNRYCPGITARVIGPVYPITLVVSNWYINPNPLLFKGLGICSPLFSVRSSDSCGIGQYTDIKGLVDVCNRIGSSLIHLLPVNDTTDKGDWADSSPYRQISCFALHPIYINLLLVLDSLPSEIYNDIQSTKWLFEQKFVVDYPTVYKYKIDTLRRIYREVVEKQIEEDLEFDKFVDQEAEWLRPYALFCFLRDKFGSADFRKWPKFSTISRREINSQCAKNSEALRFIYWIQYVCHNQFKDAKEYATQHGVVLQGDLPMGVNYNSVECWAWPKNFRLDMSYGEPPNKDNVSNVNFYSSSNNDNIDDNNGENNFDNNEGRNWGFPTYNWEYMESDNFKWWEMRLKRMYDLYHVLQINHILGFFRIWEIPRESCIRAVLGHFLPCNPLSKSDLESRGLYDIERYVQPYIRMHLIEEKFGEIEGKAVAETFFNRRNFDSHDDYYDFKEEYNTEKKIESALKEYPQTARDLKKRRHYQRSLFELLSNVMLIPDPQRRGCYQVRSNLTVESVVNDGKKTVKESSTWKELPEPAHSRMKELYEYFTYVRQNEVWLSNAGKKLEVLTKTTNMLICAEDLVKMTDSIISCIKASNILSLHVQRIPKYDNLRFDEVGNFDYLSVCSPTTHNMATIREWWEDERCRGEVCDFWRSQLHRNDPYDPPYTCETWILEMIVKQNLWSGSMWSVFLLQDLTGLVQNMRRQAAKDERINVPTDPNHHWRYRYPFSIDEIKNCEEFTSIVRKWVEECHRI